MPAKRGEGVDRFGLVQCLRDIDEAGSQAGGCTRREQKDVMGGLRLGDAGTTAEQRLEGGKD